MIKIDDIVKGQQTAESRWAKFGPYYAMFPIDFAFKVVKQYSRKGDYIIDHLQAEDPVFSLVEYLNDIA